MSSPYVVSIVSLPHQEGASINWSRELPAPADLGIDMVGVPEGTRLGIDLTLHSVSEGVYVSGSVRAHVEGRCSRCLTDFEYEMNEAVGELALYPERRAALIEEGDEEAEEMPIVDHDHVDLEPIIRDAVVLALPFTPLCKPDCQGLCSGCGERWEDLPDDHAHELPVAADDPLAALEAQLREEGARE